MIHRTIYGATRRLVKISLARAGFCLEPTFLIIGTQKGGTVALYHYLDHHPALSSPDRKEISYFSKDALYARGKHWYHSHFPLRRTAQISYEATPEYMYYPACASRIHAYNPAIRMIVLLRNPVERAFSAWNMFRNLLTEKPAYLQQRSLTSDPSVHQVIQAMRARGSLDDFDTLVRQEIEAAQPVEKAPEPSFVRRGLYAQQLEQFFSLFPRQQVLVVESQRLRAQTASTLHEISEFLGFPQFAWESLDLPHLHTGAYQGLELPQQTRYILQQYYQPHNQTLYRLLGQTFDWE
ncbi:MAG: sulfotransferase domain-containing protein [Anaerolineales bacterium]|nr:sulfotransferase domain-containing protein [Anaerolineales bacterium]